MVVFRNDCDTFCKYIAYRPPNMDCIVDQHLEDRPLEKAMRGLYYVACYRHQPADGEILTVALDQYCGCIDPDAESDSEQKAAVLMADAMNERVIEAVAQAGGTLRRGPLTYKGETARHAA